MKNYFKYFFLTGLCLISGISFSQKKDKAWLLSDTVSYNNLSINDKTILDSLLPLYHKTLADTGKITKLISFISHLDNQALLLNYSNLAVKIADNKKTDKISLLYLLRALNAAAKIAFWQGDFEKAIVYYTRAENLSEQIGDKIRQSENLSEKGIVYLNTGNLPTAIACQKKALDISTKANDKKGISRALNELASLDIRTGDIKGAIEKFSQTLNISKTLNDQTGIALALNNIGTIYLEQKDTILAMKNFEESLKILSKSNDKVAYAQSLNNMGSMLLDKSQFAKAEEYYLRSLEIKKLIGDKYQIAETLNNIGILYKKTKQFDKAMSYYEQSLNLQLEINNKEGIAYSYRSLAVLLAQNKEIAKAEKYAEQFLKLAKEIGHAKYVRDGSKLLYTIYKKENKPGPALEMYEQYKKMQDSLENEETQKAYIKQQFQYEYDKKSAADSIKTIEEKKLVQSKIEAQQAQIKQEKTQRFALYGGLMLVLIFSAFMFNRFKVTQKQKQIIQNQKDIVDEKQKEILDSINYAKRIQYTLLANKELMDANLPQHFVYFKPKAVVSGDFYWATKKENLFYIAVCDSTGHGVPGAFMSLLNISFLNEAIIEKNIKEPNKILNHVRGRLIQSMDGGQDGMDAVLLCFDSKENKVSYAAANNEPVLIRNKMIIELKKDKMPVGKGEKTDDFTLHTLNFEKGDSLFLYTDGYADQFGGQKGKKFKYKELNNLLVKNCELPIDKQMELLDNSFSGWKGELEQVDDVCIIGIKL